MSRDFWCLQLLSYQRIDDPAVGAQIMRTLLTVLPEFRPVCCHAVRRALRLTVRLLASISLAGVANAAAMPG